MKEWVRFAHAPGRTTVTVTLQQDATTVKWTVKTFPSQIAAGLAEARAGASKAMNEILDLIGDAS